jgi:hypothetical protein
MVNATNSTRRKVFLDMIIELVAQRDKLVARDKQSALTRIEEEILSARIEALRYARRHVCGD